MEDPSSFSPPLWCKALLQAAIGAQSARMVLSDLQELHAYRAARNGRRSADRWFAWQVFVCALRMMMDRLSLWGTSEGRARQASSGGGSGWWQRRWRSAAQLPRDLRVTTRSLWHRPEYAIAVVLTLGAGLCGLCTVYSLAEWVLLRPAPGVTRPMDLDVLLLTPPDGVARESAMLVSQPDAADIAEGVRGLADVTAAKTQDVNFSGGRGSPEHIHAAFVWPNYFDVLGTRMQYGRDLAADSMQDVVVLSDRIARRFWTNVRAAVGSDVIVNGLHFTVTAVAPSGFHGSEIPGTTDVWLPRDVMPAALHSPDLLTSATRSVWPLLIARNHSGVDARQVASAMNQTVTQVKRVRPGRNSFFMDGWSFRGYGGAGVPVPMRAAVAHLIHLLAIAAGALLLLTCANVANLNLARGTTMATDMAIRKSLGAEMSAIIRERLLESVVLSGLGGAVAVVLTLLCLRILSGMTLLRGGISLEGVHIDGSILVKSFAIALGTGVMAGGVPAWLASRSEAGSVLRAVRHGERRASRMRGILVVAQVSISVVLIICGGLLARSLWNLQHIDFGFDTNNVVSATIDPGMQGYDDARTLLLIADILRDLKAEPGVISAAVTSNGVLSSFAFPAVFNAMVNGVPDRHQRVPMLRWQMSSDLLDVLHIPIIAGALPVSSWLTRDSAEQLSGLLNESGLRKVLPGVSPAQAVGQMVPLSTYPNSRMIRITGIVRDARMTAYNEPPGANFFQPWSQGLQIGQFHVYVRMHPNADYFAVIRRVARRLDPALPVFDLRTVKDEVNEQLAEQRFAASLAIALAMTGTVLALLGLYGTLNNVVAERRREIGIRLALGAGPAMIGSQVVTNGLTLTASGVTIGLITSVYLSHYLGARLYNVEPFDGATYFAGATVIFIVAAVTSAIPGWRAARADPTEVLRSR